MDADKLIDLDVGSQKSGKLNIQNTGAAVPAAPPSESSQDSEASSNDFVKFDETELAGLPLGGDLLADYGRRVAADALDSVLESGLSDSKNFRMDERDLFVPKDAADASAHPQPPVDLNMDEFDPLSAKYQHQLESEILEDEAVPVEPIQRPPDVPLSDVVYKSGPETPATPDVAPLGASQILVDHPDEIIEEEEPKEPKAEPKEEPKIPKEEPKEPVDVVEEQIPPPIRHSPLTEPDSQEDGIRAQIAEAVEEVGIGADVAAMPNYNAIEENLRDAVRDVPHNHPGEYSPSGDSGHDTIGELQTLTDPQIPPSESVSSGMRELSPDLNTYDRDGPLTIPANVEEPAAVEEELHHRNVRPPTPPKEHEPGEENPQKIDLGPPPHPHQPVGLHSILKHHPWIDFRSVDPCVLDILHWRDPKKSAIALALSLIALILVAKYSFISLVAWGSLAVLGATLGFRVYKKVEAQVKKTDGSNPFKPYLESDITLPQEKVHAQADVLVQHGQCIIGQLRRLFLVENIFDSVKFGVLLWTLTYIGAWFSGITLVTIFVLALFSVPKVYELYKEPIDEYIALAKENVEKVNQTVQEKLPFLKAGDKVEKTE